MTAERTSRATRWPDILVLAVLLVLAAALRLPSLASRGGWDQDQGTHLLVVRSFVRDGAIPLVGPPTSFGGLHHGALYYDLLAPAAWLSGTDPPSVVLTIVLAGLGAVAATWWLARMLGGPLAGAIAGGLMAVSATEVAASTFIWNPTLLPLGGALALAAAWWAWTERRAVGWPISAVGLLIAMQAHLLGTLLLPPLAGLLVADLRRTREPAGRRRVRLAAVGAVGVLVVGHGQLVINELTTGFAETRSLISFVSGGGGEAAALGPVARLIVVALRLLSWPLTGLFTDALPAAVAAAGLVVVLLAWRLRASRSNERAGLRWLGVTLAWCWLALSLGVPGLSTVVRQLPVDHYHAFLDPIVLTIVGVGLASLFERNVVGRLGAAVAIGALLAWNALSQPPAVSPDGGWPAAQRAAERIQAVSRGTPIALVELPDFKRPDAYAFPLARAGAPVIARPADLPTGGLLVIVCEDLFRDSIGRPCDGPAEDAASAALARPSRLVERFAAAPGRELSLYRLGP